MEAFIEELLSYNENYDAALLEKAYLTAKRMHAGQRRKSGEPYIIHPMAVAKILAELGIDDVGLACGLLHDVVEDTEYSMEALRADFGNEIAVIVDGVTKLTSLTYESREDRQAENIRKMFLAMSKDIRVLIIKLADRLHNLRTINYMTPEKVREKCRETLDIYAPLAARLGIYAFKFEMEDIAFKNLEPEAYDALVRGMESRKLESRAVVDKVIEELNAGLSGLNIQYEIYGRTKHYYSIYKKMTIQQKNLDEIFDLMAVRVIVNTVRDCYAVLGAVHTMWTPIPGRFKDYIAMPKPNRYQSLHTTVIGENGNPFEIQIRTWEMHEVAEYGIAAHWKYKEGLSGRESEEEKLAWLRQTLEWQQEMSDSRQFVEAVKMDLFSNQVFVFTPKGDVMELPAGSTPLDFAFKVHSAVGSKCVGAKVNGKMVPIDYVLKNGEIVDIVTSANSKGPSIDWLKIVKTSSARSKIRQYLKRENKSASSEKGREMLDRSARKKGYDPEQILTNAFLARSAKEQGYAELEDLFTAVSYGGVPLNRTILLCAGYYHEKKQEELRRLEKEEAKRIAAPKRRQEKTHGVSVKGVDNLLIRFAKCCSPVPGDEIVGYTTKGRGVSIHRRDCINMLSLPPEEQARLIEVEWQAGEADMHFDAGVSILAEDRKGLLSDISKICEEMNIDITGLTAKRDKDGTSSVDVTLSISNTADMMKLISRFRQIPGAVDVYRTNS